MLLLSLKGTPTARRSTGTAPVLVKWKTDSKLWLRKRRLLIGWKWPSVSSPTLTDFAHTIWFCSAKVPRSAAATSIAAHGSAPVLPRLRKSAPSGLSARAIARPTTPIHSR